MPLQRRPWRTGSPTPPALGTVSCQAGHVQQPSRKVQVARRSELPSTPTCRHTGEGDPQLQLILQWATARGHHPQSTPIEPESPSNTAPAPPHEFVTYRNEDSMFPAAKFGGHLLHTNNHTQATRPRGVCVCLPSSHSQNLSPIRQPLKRSLDFPLPST